MTVQQNTNKLAKNSPKLTDSSKGFYTIYLVENYDINGYDISFIHKTNMKTPIIPKSSEALDIEARLEQLCETYEAEINAYGNDTTKENDEDDVMNEIENMGLEMRRVSC